MTDSINAPMTTEEAHQAMVKLVRENRAMHHVAKILEAAVLAEQNLGSLNDCIGQADNRLAMALKKAAEAEAKQASDLADIKQSLDQAMDDAKQALSGQIAKNEARIKDARDEADEKIKDITNAANGEADALAELSAKVMSTREELANLQGKVDEASKRLEAMREAARAALG